MSLRTVALSFTAVVLFISGRPTVAKASVGEALDAAIDASDLNDQTESRCQGKLGAKLDTLIDALRAAKKNPTDRAITAAKRKVKAAADIAEDRCPDRVGAPVGKKLDEVLDALDDEAGNDDGGGGGGGGGGGYVKAKFGTITVGNGSLDGQTVIELNPKNITLTGCKGRSVFMAMGVAPKGSDGYEWSSFDAAEVLYDPVTWKDGGVFRFYTAWLADHDTANGQWIAKFGLYDADTKEELASKSVSFSFSAQDAAMDSESYNALLDGLANSTTDFSRLDLLTAQIANQRITSKQLGPILDYFGNELIRLDAARAAVPRVTNKTAALVWANKFANSLLADDYRALCAP